MGAIPDVEYIVPPPGYEYEDEDENENEKENEDENDLAASPETPKSQRMFKRHRVLPHPRGVSGSMSGTPESRRTVSGGQRYYENPPSELSENQPGSHVASHHTLRHQRRRISGGDLPPTPPAHSRTSSSSHSVNLSTPSPLHTPAQSSEDVPSKTNPSTPPNQRSPPTPDVTPPQPTSRPQPPTLRPTLYDRIPSKSTTDSRAESFETARESPAPSDKDDGRSTLRSAAISTRTSQITVRQAPRNGSEHKKSQDGLSLSLGPESNLGDDHADLNPNSRVESTSLDGEWGPGSEVEQEWDGGLLRNVTVKKSRPSKQANGQRHEVVDDFPVSPTNATKAVRGLPLHGRILTYDSPEPPLRSFAAPEAAKTKAAYTEADIDADIRRFSGMSSKSAASTVVEAILVEAPPRQQRRTLRHVKRVDALRDSIWHSPPSSSTATFNSARPGQRSGEQTWDAPRESYASNTTANSVSSRKARREVWKNGGIPVVVVPDRLSSNRSSSRDHSLRSSSSKRSKRSQSFGSVPLEQLPNGHDFTPYFDRPPRRGRLMSDSDGSTPGDQRTMDFPPFIPQRTSSLSAPGSRNGSRSQSRDASRNGSWAESLTAESLRAHNAMQAKLANGISPMPSAGATKHMARESSDSQSPGQGELPVVTVHSVPSLEILKSTGDQEGSEGQQQHLDSGHGSPLLSTKATPFSQTSVETSGTSAADIGEARAVSMVPHKIRSVVMVDHRPSESPDGDQRSQVTAGPTITTTETDGVTKAYEADPVTPSQGRPTLDDVDSPLRNPRAPPEPPAINFIPATPSGLTPAEEKTKMLGNFYEELEEKPARSPSIVRRALGKRRNSSRGPSPVRKPQPGFLSRTFSLSRNTRKDTIEDLDPDYALPDGLPEDVDESRLHPDWRPTYYPNHYDNSDDDDGVYDLDDEEARGALRYPPVDNRPHPPRRSLSERMKRTFAIMPLEDDAYDYEGGPERRTLKRTSSGNLRVVKKCGSVSSSLGEHRMRRPSVSSDGGRRRQLWPRSSSLRRTPNRHDATPEEGRRADRANPPRTSETRKPWSVSQNIGTLTRRLSEKRREKRSSELRQKISGPQEVRDGDGDVIRREAFRDAFNAAEEDARGRSS